MKASELQVGDTFLYANKRKALTVTKVIANDPHPRLQGKVLVMVNCNQYVFDCTMDVKLIKRLDPKLGELNHFGEPHTAYTYISRTGNEPAGAVLLASVTMQNGVIVNPDPRNILVTIAARVSDVSKKCFMVVRYELDGRIEGGNCAYGFDKHSFNSYVEKDKMWSENLRYDFFIVLVNPYDNLI